MSSVDKGTVIFLCLPSQLPSYSSGHSHFFMLTLLKTIIAKCPFLCSNECCRRGKCQFFGWYVVVSFPLWQSCCAVVIGVESTTEILSPLIGKMKSSCYHPPTHHHHHLYFDPYFSTGLLFYYMVLILYEPAVVGSLV